MTCPGWEPPQDGFQVFVVVVHAKGRPIFDARETPPFLTAIRRASSQSAGPSMGFVVFVIGGDPVLGDSFLHGSKIELLVADHFAD